jgi:hypothetical protein
VNPETFIASGQKLYGRKKWKAKLAEDLGVDVTTIWRLTKRAQIPGPYEIALKAMLDNKRRQDALEREARKLLPRKFRKRKVKP